MTVGIVRVVGDYVSRKTKMVCWSPLCAEEDAEGGNW